MRINLVKIHFEEYTSMDRQSQKIFLIQSNNVKKYYVDLFSCKIIFSDLLKFLTYIYL